MHAKFARYLFWIGLALFILWFVKASGIIVAASLFLLAGIIPGTQWSLSPITMLILSGVVLVIVLYWIKRQRLAQQIKELKKKHESNTKSNNNKPTKQKPNQPRARYSQPKVAAR